MGVIFSRQSVQAETVPRLALGEAGEHQFGIDTDPPATLETYHAQPLQYFIPWGIYK